jgi:hypothetical protein
MKTIARSLLLLVLMVAAALPASGEVGTLDKVPGATLLLPYFEVDVSDPATVNTVMTVTNSTAMALVAKVTLWTDLGLPTYAFEVYFTGYDSTIIDLRLLFHGIVPLSADDSVDFADTSDPMDGISNQGLWSQDINYPSVGGPCSRTTPESVPFVRLEPSVRVFLQRAHTGQSASVGDLGNPWFGWGGGCGAINHGDSIARGYVTVDVVNACTYLLPTSAEYQLSTAVPINALFGEYVVIERAQNRAWGDSLVSLEGDGWPFNPDLNEEGRYSFYSPYYFFARNGMGGGREPLATQWRARFTNASETDVIVWRDPGGIRHPFACGSPPADIGATEVSAFDEVENAESLETTSFPYAANRVPIDALTTFSSGVLHLNLNAAMDLGPTESPSAQQSFVAVVHTVPGQLVSARSAFPLDSAMAPSQATVIDRP